MGTHRLRGRARVRVAASLLVLACLIGLAPTSAAPTRRALVVREVGRQLGLPRSTHSWDVTVARIDGNRSQDLVLGYHATIKAYRVVRSGLHRTFAAGGGDPHACDVADVDLDGRPDLYCTRGADLGTISKRNRLWLQVARGEFRDRAGRFGVTDPFGRGRHPTFFDLNHDPYPDLFVGNGTGRLNGRPSRNRTFANMGGTRFDEVRIGATAEVGAMCAHAVDVDADGWQDLLVCGERHLMLYRNRRGPDGERRLRDVAPSLAIDLAGVRGALIVDLDGDGEKELLAVTSSRFRIVAGLPGGVFGDTVLDLALVAGSDVAVGQVDDRHGLDVVLVRGCRDGGNVDDLLLLDRDGWRYARVRLRATAGCGDVAGTLDIDRDGAAEVIVMNGQVNGPRGPVQVFTMGAGWAA